MLVAAHGDTVSLSLAHKRWSQGEAGEVVIEDVRRTAPFRPDAPTAEEAAFLASLAVSSLPTPRPVCALSGLARPRRRVGSGPDHRHVCPAGFTPTAHRRLREGLDTYARLQRDIAALRAQAAKEKQLNRRVELNLEIKRLEAELAATDKSTVKEKKMKKLTAEDPETKSPDLVAENIEQLKALFPEAFTEGKVDFEVLKQLLGGAVDEREEKYGLNWHGKRRARQLALTPSTGTLRPCPEDSVDWDTTQNLMIEGDNLEVLKLLQKSYAGKVKLIYIDPPYNTGKDFVYPDDFQDNIKNYLELTGQVDGDGNKISSNTEASGRFHTDWLNMMYPRLKLARNLARIGWNDGCINIDDTELANLRRILDEVFGEENFVNTISVKARSQLVHRWRRGYTLKQER